MTARLFEFELPEYQLAVHLVPVVPRERVVYLHADAGEFLLITARCFFRDDFPAIEIFLNRQEYLVGVDRLDEIIGNLVADGLVHDVLLFALGNHDDGNMWRHLLDAGEGFKATQSRHVLIENYQVEMLFLHLFEGIEAVVYGNNLVSLLAKENDVGLQQIDLIVGPKQGFTLHTAYVGFLRQIQNTPRRNVPRQAV